MNIAIDGPAGAGKSTIAKIIAQRLDYIYIDTGAMYRAVALETLRSGVQNDTCKICALLKDLRLEIKHDSVGQRIIMNNIDVTDDIRTSEVSKAASDTARIPQVRLRLVELQREMARKNNVVMDGRDIGTYVLPDAEVKIFLIASPDERAKRRYKELLAKNQNISLEDVRKDIKYRDKNDSEREFAPLKQADDAILIDSTGKSIQAVADQITEIILKRKGTT